MASPSAFWLWLLALAPPEMWVVGSFPSPLSTPDATVHNGHPRRALSPRPLPGPTTVYASQFIVSGNGTESDPFVGSDQAAGILAAANSVPHGPVTVVVGRGFYRVSKPLHLRNDTRVVGAGKDATVLANRPFTPFASWGSLQAGAALANLSVDGNRWDKSNTGPPCGFGGFAIVGPNVSMSRVSLRNMACGCVLPKLLATGLRIEDSVFVDCHWGIWAEATCGYASHWVARNTWLTTRPGGQDAINYDNGNTDGVLDCPVPPTAKLRSEKRNRIVSNTVIASQKLGIAVARMGGFTIEDNRVTAPNATIRTCPYSWCDPNGGNSIHIEHESFDIDIVGNRVEQGGCERNCSVGVGIWVADSSNVTVTNNTVTLMNSTRDCIQYATPVCDNGKPNHAHDHCGPRAGFAVKGNSVQGCRSGVNIWGNGTVGLRGVIVAGNTASSLWLSGISVGSVDGVAVHANRIQRAPMPVLIQPQALAAVVDGNTFTACGTCNISYHGNPAITPPATAFNNSCGTA